MSKSALDTLGPVCATPTERADDADDDDRADADARTPGVPLNARTFEPAIARVLARMFIAATACALLSIPGVFLAEARVIRVSQGWFHATQCSMSVVAVFAALAWLALPRARVTARGTPPPPTRPRGALSLPRDVTVPHPPDPARWRPVTPRDHATRFLAIGVIVVGAAFLLLVLFVAFAMWNFGLR